MPKLKEGSLSLALSSRTPEVSREFNVPLFRPQWVTGTSKRGKIVWRKHGLPPSWAPLLVSTLDIFAAVFKLVSFS